MSSGLLTRACRRARRRRPRPLPRARVSNLIGLIIEATGLQTEIGEVCLVEATARETLASGELPVG